MVITKKDVPIFYLLDSWRKTQSKGEIEHQLQESNKTMCWYLCVHMNVLFGHLSDTHKGNKHRQNDRPRCEEKVISLLMCCGSQPQASLSQPGHYYCTWPLSALGQPRLTTLTKLPRCSYICLVCHSGTQPCQRKFTACMNNNLNTTFQHSGIQSMSGPIQ